MYGKIPASEGQASSMIFYRLGHFLGLISSFNRLALVVPAFIRRGKFSKPHICKLEVTAPDQMMLFFFMAKTYLVSSPVENLHPTFRS